MKRESLVIEIQRRLNLIKIANGCTFDISYVFRNPEEEPTPEAMPCTNLFEMQDAVTEERSRGTRPPLYLRELTIILESWYKSVSTGVASKDILTFLKHMRTAIFSDGVTLGGLSLGISETEVSRIFRPPIGNNVVGIGMVLRIKYLEDFSNL